MYETSVSRPVSVWHEPANISDEGRKRMKRLFETQLAEVNFELYGSSMLKRAIQAAEMLSSGSHVIKWKELGPISIKAWDDWHKKNRMIYPSLSCNELRNISSSALLDTEGCHMLDFIKSVAGRIKLGQNALLVSHEILVACAAAHAKGTSPFSLAEKEFNGIIFHFGEGKELKKCEFI